MEVLGGQVVHAWTTEGEAVLPLYVTMGLLRSQFCCHVGEDECVCLCELSGFRTGPPNWQIFLLDLSVCCFLPGVSGIEHAGASCLNREWQFSPVQNGICPQGATLSWSPSLGPFLGESQVVGHHFLSPEWLLREGRDFL